MTSYHLERTQLDSAWDEFVALSENGTIFCSSDYVHSLNLKVGAYYCFKNKERRAALLVGESDDCQSAILHDLIIYNGILFGSKAHRQNRAQRISEQFAITTAIAEKLIEIYDNIEISLHPTIIDIRPFLWVNYGTNKPQYVPSIRYTSYVDISHFASIKNFDDLPLYRNASSARRQEIRYAIREGVVTREHHDTDLFIDFYDKTMLRQDIQMRRDVLEEMRKLINNLIKMNRGKMFTSFTSAAEPGSMAFFGFDRKRAYYIFGANDPQMRHTHTGTAVLWDAFAVLSKEGISEVDLEGVNSPQRGWFKLSFGGNIIPYYQISFKKNKYEL